MATWEFEQTQDVLGQFGAGETPAQKRAREDREASEARRLQRAAIAEEERRQELRDKKKKEEEEKAAERRVAAEQAAAEQAAAEQEAAERQQEADDKTAKQAEQKEAYEKSLSSDWLEQYRRSRQPSPRPAVELDEEIADLEKGHLEEQGEFGEQRVEAEGDARVDAEIAALAQELQEAEEEDALIQEGHEVSGVAADPEGDAASLEELDRLGAAPDPELVGGAYEEQALEAEHEQKQKDAVEAAQALLDDPGGVDDPEGDEWSSDTFDPLGAGPSGLPTGVSEGEDETSAKDIGEALGISEEEVRGEDDDPYTFSQGGGEPAPEEGPAPEPGAPPEPEEDEDEDEDDDDDDDRDIGDVGDDISGAVNDLLEHLDGYERRVEWRDGVPVIQIWDEESQTWSDDPQFDQERAAGIVAEVRDELEGFEELDLEEEHTELQKLIDSLAGTGSPEDVDAAYDEAARMLGHETGEDLETYMQDLVAEMEGGVSGQEGLSEEQMATFRAGTEATIRRDEELMARQLEQVMGERGSSMAYMHAADNARREIRDTRVLAEVDLLQQDMLRQKENYDALKERYQFSVGATADIKSQHMQELIQVRTAAAREMSNRISLLTDQYQAESSALASWTQSMYTAMEMDLGLQQHVMDQMDDAYERELRPHLDRIQVLSAEATIKALESQVDLTDAQAQAVRDAQGLLDKEQQGEDTGNFLEGIGDILGVIPIPGFEWIGPALKGLGTIFG